MIGWAGDNPDREGLLGTPERVVRAYEEWSGETVERPSDPTAPFSAIAFKIMSDPYVGKLTFVRAYSGVLKKGTQVLNVSTGKKERIGRLADELQEILTVASVEGEDFTAQVVARGSANSRL